jgi:hypothetical protein
MSKRLASLDPFAQAVVRIERRAVSAGEMRDAEGAVE